MGGLQGQALNKLQENRDEKQAACLLESEFLFLSYYYSEG